MDKIVFLDFREVITSNPVIMIFRPGNNFDIYLYYLVVVIFYSIVSYFLIRYINKKLPKYSKKSLTLLLFFIYLPLLLVINKFAPIAKVDSVEVVTGEALTSSNVYVFVRPLDGNGNYWTKPTNKFYVIPDQNNMWRITSHFGGNRELRYEIIAIAKKQPLGNTVFPSSCPITNHTFIEISKGADIYVRIVENKQEAD